MKESIAGDVWLRWLPGGSGKHTSYSTALVFGPQREEPARCRSSTRRFYLPAFVWLVSPLHVVALRRLASVFAVALAVLVTIQTLDLVPCADETEQSGTTSHSDTDGGGSLADCLCHVTFTRVDAFPVVAAAPVAPPPAYAPFVAQLASADGPTVEHVPLA